MRSDRALTTLAATLLIGCGSTHSLSVAAPPFVTIHGHVDLGSVTDAANGAPLLAGIVWGAVPSIPPVCYEQASDPVMAKLCPDPCGFFPGTIDETTIIDPDGGGDFDLPLYHLPPQTALVGSATSDVAYATVLVVADNDQNGTIDLLHSLTIRGGAGGGVFGGGGDAGDDDAGQPDSGVERLAVETVEDTVLAASFVSVTQPNQERLSFLQGGFSGLEDFYPAPACGTPPSGYSVLDTGPVAGTTPTCLQLPDAGATCDAEPASSTIEAFSLTAPDGGTQAATAFACRGHTQLSVAIQPSDGTPPVQFPTSGSCDPSGSNACTAMDGVQYHCINDNLLVLFTGTDCPTFVVFALSGCNDDPACTTPMWDETESPPSWWPCGS